MSELLEYKCPCCGGDVEFDANSQRMKCPYCDTEFDIEELKAAQENLDNPPQDNIQWNKEENQWNEDNSGGIKVYVCNSCGGEIVGDSMTAASSCPFCGNPVVMTGQLSGDLKPDIIIPFKLDKEAAKQLLKKHIATKKLIPKIFKDENHIDEIKGLYVPEWLFNCTADADITYQGEKIRTWSDKDFHYTEKSVYRIHRNGTIDVNDLPVDGSSKMADPLMESIEPFDVSEAVDFNTAYLSGYFADRYDVSAEDSIERANQRIKESAADIMRGTVDGGYSGVTTESSQINVENGSYRYALYPVWILNTSWKGEKFTFAVNGQTGKIVGDLPLDKSAFWKWVGILTAVMGAAAYGLTWFLGTM